jgi:enoyl-[acyl-carrier-protein] reductase (NADH)
MQTEFNGKRVFITAGCYAIGTSMQCYVDAEEIADMNCFLSSDYGCLVSGQIIGVDGNTETPYSRS